MCFNVCINVSNWRRRVLIAFREKCQDVFWKAFKCFDKLSSGALHGVVWVFFLAWCERYLCNVKENCILKRRLSLHWLDCHFHANRLLEAELNGRQETFRVCLRRHKYDYCCLLSLCNSFFIKKKKSRTIFFLTKDLTKKSDECVNFLTFFPFWKFPHCGQGVDLALRLLMGIYWHQGRSGCVRSSGQRGQLCLGHPHQKTQQGSYA